MEGGPPVTLLPLAPPSDLSATEQPGQPDSTAGPESLPLRPHDFSVLTPSARTSYTRVDLSAADIGRRTGGEEDGGGSESDGDEGAQGEQGPQEVEPTPHMPQVSLTFLLVSGRRRTMSFDHEITVGRAKELIWNAWPNGGHHLLDHHLVSFLHRNSLHLERKWQPLCLCYREFVYYVC